MLSALAVPLRRTGAAGRLAVAGVGGAPGRAASVSVVVALGVCLVGSTLTCLASLDSYERYKRTLEAPADFRLYAGRAARWTVRSPPTWPPSPNWPT
ncbi:hypothetical protein ACFQV4_06000 [Streptomyces thermocarboxydus]